MKAYNLNTLFYPRSIAIIGASDKPSSAGCFVTQNILESSNVSSHIKNIYLINPNREYVFHHDTVASIDLIDDAIDLAVIIIPLPYVPDVLFQCARNGCFAAVIISSGGKETGPQGKEIEERIAKIASEKEISILGPNCLGFINNTVHLNATFSNQEPLPGKMAFISQSGAICSTITDLALKKNIGISHMVSLGNMVNVDFGDMIDFLGNRREVSSIVIYMESLTNIRKFMSAARAVSRMKPIVVLKTGRSPSGARAASSHTGSLAGEDDVYSAAFERTGIVRVKTFEELFDCAELLAKQPRPPKPDLAVVTNAGGMGVISMDSLGDYGVEPVRLQERTIARLDEVLPSNWSRSNPVDIRGDATSEEYRQAAEILLDADEVKGILFIHVPQAISSPVETASVLVELFQNKKLPVITSWMGGGSESEEAREIFHQANIPTFDTVERAVRAFMDLHFYARNLESLQQVPPKLERTLESNPDTAKRIIQEGCRQSTPQLTELESKKLLEAYGIPVNKTVLATSREEVISAARKLSYPLVLKIHSRDILHKTEANGVRLNLRNEDEILEAFDSILDQAKGYNPQARLDGVTIQPMASHIDHEFILGAKKDKDFGPFILFGMGGVIAEVVGDRAIGLPPLNRLLAERLIRKTKISRLLDGYRNMPAVDFAHLEEIMIRLSQLVSDFSQIEELDINPLVASGNSLYALDARVVLDPKPSIESPQHLVISPYPNQYETYFKIKNDELIFVRPIKPEDAPLMLVLFDTLSEQSIYFRYFRPLKTLPHDMLVQFTQVDYDREIALVALEAGGMTEKMIGVARIIQEQNGEVGEFSVLVSDSWHGKGVGAALLSNCLYIAKEQGYKKIWGLVLPDNTNMLALGKKLGFTVQRSGSMEYLLNIDLQELEWQESKICRIVNQSKHVSEEEQRKCFELKGN